MNLSSDISDRWYHEDKFDDGEVDEITLKRQSDEEDEEKWRRQEPEELDDGNPGGILTWEGEPFDDHSELY